MILRPPPGILSGQQRGHRRGPGHSGQNRRHRRRRPPRFRALSRNAIRPVNGNARPNFPTKATTIGVQATTPNSDTAIPATNGTV
ncbi:hypothetical protein ACFQ9X_22605 [Catenulispora yoronensis]